MCKRSGIHSAIDTGLAAQATVSTLAHLEDVSTPLCNYFDDSRNGVADGGVFMKSSAKRAFEQTVLAGEEYALIRLLALRVSPTCMSLHPISADAVLATRPKVSM